MFGRGPCDMMKEALKGIFDFAKLVRDKVPVRCRKQGELILLALMYLQSRMGCFSLTML